MPSLRLEEIRLEERIDSSTFPPSTIAGST
jgi:hypothetical protein